MKKSSLSFTIFFCCYCLSVVICTEPCLLPRKLDLFALQVSCQAASLADLSCEAAIDEDLNSFWHPVNQREKSYTLSWQPMIRLTQIRILQYNWPHGRAKKIGLSINGHNLEANLRPRVHVMDWDRVTLPFTILTNHVDIQVKEVDQMLFGGFKEIQLFGCDQNYHYGPPSTTWRPRPPIIVTTPVHEGDTNEDLQRPSHSPAAIGFYVGVGFGLLVVLIFIVISIVACCTKDDEPEDEIMTNADLISIKSRPSSRLSSRSGSVILVKPSQNPKEEDKIEVIEEIDETQSVQDII